MSKTLAEQANKLMATIKYAIYNYRRMTGDEPSLIKVGKEEYNTIMIQYTVNSEADVVIPGKCFGIKLDLVEKRNHLEVL